MRQDTNKYQFKQLETYKEELELKHIKIKTLIVNIMNFVFSAIVIWFLIRLDTATHQVITFGSLFVVLFVVNIAMYAYDNDHYNNLRLAMYFNTIMIFSIVVALIIVFQTPSIFTALFLAYAITAIYQDYKVMVLSNFIVFIFGLLLVVGFPDILNIPNNTTPQVLLILVFLFVFVILLTLSSYILIKRKSFFYNQLAHINELEVRNIDTLYEIELKKTKNPFESQKYYESLRMFSKELSKKIGIENIFERKISLLEDMKKHSSQELTEMYPEYTVKEINRLRQMELEVNHKMRNLGVKASKTYGIEVDRKEIFSESQFKSFNHFEDDRYVKIISFVVFYVLTRVDKLYLKELDDYLIKDVLMNSEYYYRINREILDIYLNNNEVFDTIVDDLLKDRCKYETID
jgi:hypothetical protein